MLALTANIIISSAAAAAAASTSVGQKGIRSYLKQPKHFGTLLKKAARSLSHRPRQSACPDKAIYHPNGHSR
jgi:F0F1-type ATP synthase membrane subunit c/vacuolar-type H+-ATPase subunit K